MNPISFFRRTFIGIYTLAFFASIFLSSFPFSAQANNSPWTIEKATHLANRALFNASEEIITQLYESGSASSAVDILFADPSTEEQEAFEVEKVAILDGINFEAYGNIREHAFFYLSRDPEEARQKLSLIFEDVFSTAVQGGARIPEFIFHAQWDQSIYEDLDKPYEEILKKTMREFAQARYLNLLNGNKNRPNQDFAREILQLFLMEEYRPLDKTHSGERNYSEQDIENLSFLLTGYRFHSSYTVPDAVVDGDRYKTFTTNNGDQSVVYFDRNYHNTTPLVLFDEEISIPVGNDPAEILIPYILEKKEDAIAEFLAWKLVNNYITTDFTEQEIEPVKQILKDTNFNIFETTKQLLASDLMYTEKSMQEFRYKTPVDIVVGMVKQFDGSAKDISPTYHSYLHYFDFVLMAAPSIFGRDGMDNNHAWINDAYYGNYGTYIAYTLPFRIMNETGNKDDFKYTESETATQYVTRMESQFLGGRSLPSDVKDAFIVWVSEMKLVNSIMSDTDLKQFIGAIVLQPEYLLLSGEGTNPIIIDDSQTLESDDVVIYHWIAGGPDFQHIFIPKHDPNYEFIKGPLAIPAENRSPLIGKDGEEHEFYDVNTNAFGEDFLQYYRDGKLNIFNGVAQIGQSRGHNHARETMETGGVGNDKGYLAQVFEGTPLHTTQIIKGSIISPIARGLNSSSRVVRNVSVGTTTDSLKAKELLENRSLPGVFSYLIPNSLNVAQLRVDNDIDASTEKGRVDIFAEQIASNNAMVLTNLIGGFDSHRDQAPYLVGETADGETDVSESFGVENKWNVTTGAYKELFDTFKTRFPEKDLTIVLYGEFGRTTVPNKTYGTDHGRGSGMFVLSTKSEELFGDLPQLIGRMNTGDNQLNWQDVQIDVRSIWDHLFTNLYGVSNFEELNPLPLSFYVKLDALYDHLIDARYINETSFQASQQLVEELKTELAENTFAPSYFVDRLDVVKSNFAPLVSHPDRRKIVFSFFGFEQSLGDASFHPQQMKSTGDIIPDFPDGFIGKGLLLEKGERYDNDKYGYYTPALSDNNPNISENGNSVFFWLKPESFKANTLSVLQNNRNGAVIKISDQGQNGAKKLTVDYKYYDADKKWKTVPVVTVADSPDFFVEQWSHIGLITDIENSTFTVTVNGDVLAVLEDIQFPENSLRIQLGNSSMSGEPHTAIVDELKIFGKVFSLEEAKQEYYTEKVRSAEFSLQPEKITAIKTEVQLLSDSLDFKSSLLKRIENIDHQKISGDMPLSFRKEVTSCIKNTDTIASDGEVKLVWKGSDLFEDEQMRDIVTPIFIEGIDKNYISWTYDQPTKQYTFSVHPTDDITWWCYFKNNPFFIKHFE